MPERRYSDDEVKHILSNAAESDTALTEATAERGMTLAEIERIAVEAGLTPASVRAAATSLDRLPQAPMDVRFLGMRVGVGQSVALPRPLSDVEWRRVVVLLRDLFQAQGREQEFAGHREWRNGNLRVTLETLGDGAVLQMRTRRGDARSMIAAGMAFFFGGTLAAGAEQMAHPGTLAVGGPLMFVFVGAAVAGAGAMQVHGWSAARQAQFQQVADFALRLSAAEGDETSVTR